MNIENKLTVLIITYDRANFLEKTLRQLFDKQSPIRKCNFIIFDNNSEDNTTNVVSSFIKLQKITYIKNKFNIGGDANAVRAFEYGAGVDTEYIWLLCDDDVYNFNHWRLVEKEIEKGTDIIGVANYSFKNKTFNNIHNQFFQLSFIPAGIYRKSIITEDVIRNMYDSIYCMFPQLCIAAKVINDNGSIVFIKHAIVDNGIHAKNAKTHDVSYTRSNSKDLSTKRRKEQLWIIGFSNILLLIDDEKIRNKTMLCSIKYKDIYGNMQNFISCMNEIKSNKDYRSYIYEIIRVLPEKEKIILENLDDSNVNYYCKMYEEKSIIEYLKTEIRFLVKSVFSIRREKYSKLKFISFFGIRIYI